VYSVAIGLFAGRWLAGNPLLAALLGIAIALAIGVIIDRVSSTIGRRRARRSPDPLSTLDSAPRECSVPVSGACVTSA
jgi:hypothetical protein